MARDLKGDGIAVALIHPGAVSCPVKFNLIFSNQGENADEKQCECQRQEEGLPGRA